MFEIIKLGLKPKEIKKFVIETLEPYFENRDVLDEFAIETLIPESITLLRLQRDKRFFEMFKKCLFTYRSAKVKDPQASFKSCVIWHPYVLNSVSEFWSVLHLEVDKGVLEVEEFLHVSWEYRRHYRRFDKTIFEGPPSSNKNCK